MIIGKSALINGILNANKAKEGEDEVPQKIEGWTKNIK